MKQNIYSIYDTVACVFNKPFTDINDASAERAFRQSASEQPHIKDYELFSLGSLNDGTGAITPNANPVKIITGLQIASDAVQDT